MNFLTLSGLSAVLHGYVAFRLIPDLADFPLSRLGLATMLVASALLIPLGLMARRITGAALAERLGWAGLLCMGLFSSLIVLTLLRDAAFLLLWAINFLVPEGLELALWRTASAQAVPFLGGLATLLGFWSARRTAAVVRVDVPIQGLPLAWQGFTVAQISDIHVGPTIRQHYVRRIVDRVNTLQADMVAITGDLVDGQVTELAAQVAPLADL